MRAFVCVRNTSVFRRALHSIHTWCTRVCEPCVVRQLHDCGPTPHGAATATPGLKRSPNSRACVYVSVQELGGGPRLLQERLRRRAAAPVRQRDAGVDSRVYAWHMLARHACEFVHVCVSAAASCTDRPTCLSTELSASTHAPESAHASAPVPLLRHSCTHGCLAVYACWARVPQELLSGTLDEASGVLRLLLTAAGHNAALAALDGFHSHAT
jgi:hypothetical protein